MKSVVVDTRRVRLGGRPAARADRWRETVIYEAHLAGFTADPSSGRRARAARHVRRASSTRSRTSSTSGSPPSSCCRSSRSTAWRRRPAWSTTGATSRCRSSPRTPRTRARPGPTAAVDEFRDLVKALHRAGIEVILDVVYNHTAEVGADGPTFVFRGLANDDYYLLDGGRRLHRRQRDRQHVQRQPPDRPPADPRQPALLGPGDARRRLPVRPRRGPVARRGRPADDRSAGALGHRDRPGPGRHQAHRRGLGRRRPVPGRQLRRRALGRVERPVPRRRRARSSRAIAGTVPARHAAVPRQPGHLRPQAPRAAGERQLRHLPRRLHAQRPRLVRRASTTRRTARATATATTRT